MEVLSNNFNNLLTQYKDTYEEFLNTINYDNASLTTIPNFAFIGKDNINMIQGSSVNNCLSECTSNKNCSGATFDNDLNTCTLSSGIGNVIKSQNKTAIVKQALFYTNKLQQINIKLMEINSAMMNLANSNMDNFSKSKEDNIRKGEILNQNYQTLETERSDIEEMMREFQSLNSAIENESMNATSNYYNYIMYIFIAIFLVIVLMRINLTSEQSGGGYGKFSPLLFIFLSSVIVFNAYLKN